MDHRTHPLLAHIKASGETVTSFADRVGISRMHLYRVVRGENVTTNILTRISEATGGAVPVQAFFPEQEAKSEQDNG